MKEMRYFGPWRALLGGGILWIAGALSAFSQSSPSAGSGIPEQPFESEPSTLESRSTSSSVQNEEIPTGSKSADKEQFSLWDFFSQFFELGSPGDPNHPDKLRLSIATTLGYDDNVFTTNVDQVASGTAGVTGVLSYKFGSERLKIASSLVLGTTYYDNRPGDDTDYNGNFGLMTSYFVTRRLQLTGDASIAYLSQPNPMLIGGVSRFSGDYTAMNLGLGMNYNIRPRLSVRLQYRYNSIEYADEVQNQSSGFINQNYIVGFDYLMSPRLTLSAEYRYNTLAYYEAEQDSTGQIFSLGFTANFSPKLKWTFLAGAEARTLNNTSQPGATSNYLGPFLETDAEYGFAPNSSLIGSLRYGTEPSGTAGISVRETLRGALTLRYAFSGRLMTDATISYEHDNYDQPGETNDFAQEYYTGSLGLSYQFNPALALTLRYEYSSVKAEDEINSYTRDITSLGLEIIF